MNVLVVSNNCFSPSNSNGRTLGNLFYGWPKENLAQMCIIASDPAWDVCDNYYCIEDRTVLSAFLHCRKAVGRRLKKVENRSENHDNGDTCRKSVVRKTMPKVLLREMVWARQRWQSHDFEEWIDSFCPNLVVFQFGDTSFMMDIALYVAQSRNIPLVVYNTEGYYFFNKSWYSPSFLDSVIFPFYRKYYHGRVNRLMAYATHSVYLNDKLKCDYDRVFKTPSSVVYNSSSINRSESPLLKDVLPYICYLGGLGHGRDKAIIEVGEVLHNINDLYHIDVYGPADEGLANQLNDSVGVKYHGVVSYEKVKDIMSESDILFHVEPPADSDNQLRYAFSTKIADSLKSGKCFVIYAPKELACSKYIVDNRCGWLAETKEELYDVILRILNNEQERSEILERARLIACDNHSYEGNARKFQKILTEAVVNHR